MLEIERKYVVLGAVEDQMELVNNAIRHADLKMVITQGYLANEVDKTVRIRIKDVIDHTTGSQIDSKALITIKG
jgi:CYTH domain-containing protein